MLTNDVKRIFNLFTTGNWSDKSQLSSSCDETNTFFPSHHNLSAIPCLNQCWEFVPSSSHYKKNQPPIHPLLSIRQSYVYYIHIGRTLKEMNILTNNQQELFLCIELFSLVHLIASALTIFVCLNIIYISILYVYLQIFMLLSKCLKAT